LRIWCEIWGVFDRIDRDKGLSGKQLKKFKFSDFCWQVAAFLIENLTLITGILTDFQTKINKKNQKISLDRDFVK